MPGSTSQIRDLGPYARECGHSMPSTSWGFPTDLHPPQEIENNSAIKLRAARRMLSAFHKNKRLNNFLDCMWINAYFTASIQSHHTEFCDYSPVPFYNVALSTLHEKMYQFHSSYSISTVEINAYYKHV